MDYITKNKIVTLLVLLLCCTNIAVVVFMFNMFPRGPKWEMHSNMDERLRLSSEQRTAIAELRHDHMIQLHRLFERTDQLRKEMVSFAFAESPDNNQIDQTASELGRLNTEFELRQLENMQAIVKHLTSEQIAELKKIMDEMDRHGPGFMGNPFGQPGGPKGPKGPDRPGGHNDFGPDNDGPGPGGPMNF